jgi:cell growth-regulating nucleolar protein
MVCFQCDICVETLKKKQVETHFQFRCRNAYSFSCLTCWKVFDRETIKEHTSCVSEDQKYKSTDKKFVNDQNSKPQANGNTNALKTNGNVGNPKYTNIISKIEEKLLNDEEIKEITWSGFKKTALKLFEKINLKELKISELTRYLMKIFVQCKKDDTVDQEEFKKLLIKKIKESDRLIIK